jgi:uncharacterized RDD family membrane protein YckC
MMFKFFAAVLYDWIVVIAIFFIFTAITILFNGGHAINSGTRWYQITLLLILFLYYVMSLKYGGQTIGLRSWGLKMVSNYPELRLGILLMRITLIIPAHIIGHFHFLKTQNIIFRWTKTRLVFVKNESA